MHNSTQELLDLRDSHGAGFQYGPFPHDLVATWKSGFPTGDAAAALASLLAATGWAQMGACRGRAGIAAEACAAGFGGGEGGGGGRRGGGGGGGGGLRRRWQSGWTLRRSLMSAKTAGRFSSPQASRLDFFALLALFVS
jgi:hypothetical protein